MTRVNNTVALRCFFNFLIWDFWQTIWKQMGCLDINFKSFHSLLRNINILRNKFSYNECIWNDSIWCLKERFVQIFPDSISFKSFTEINYFAHTGNCVFTRSQSLTDKRLLQQSKFLTYSVPGSESTFWICPTQSLCLGFILRFK